MKNKLKEKLGSALAWILIRGAAFQYDHFTKDGRTGTNDWERSLGQYKADRFGEQELKPRG